MKKIFTFLASILISAGMFAVDQLSMGQFGSWDAEKMQVAEGNVITYDEGSSWVGGDVWLGIDLSAYEYVCIVLEDCQGDFKFTLEYEKIEGDEKNICQEYYFNPGTTQVTFKLDPNRKVKVNKLMLQNTSNGGTLDVGNLYAGSAAEFEMALDLGTFSGWSSNYDATTRVLSMTRAWDGGQWWLGEADYSEYVNLVVEFDEATCGGYVAVEYNNSIAKTKSGYSAGATSVSVPIREEGASSVQKITINGDTDAATITLGAAYLVFDVMQIENKDEEGNDGTTTGIADITAPATIKGTYNIMGCVVSAPSAPGFYISNGKKVLVVK